MAIFHELDLVKFSELFSVNFDELRHYDNVVGLPLTAVYEMMKTLGAL